ncbi:DUF6153 family protein [Streptomyces sp. NPDC004134]|uniref:DUF6153 family protein n=1 Tax=Streptomyces sp. NPDC004134 TaxID=3364691 RepID=UPI00369E703D
MTGSIRIGPRRRPAGRLFAVLVLAVLAGLLGMHALGPGGAPGAERPTAMASGHGASQAQAPMTAQMPMPVAGAQEAAAGHAPAGQAPGAYAPVAQTPASHPPASHPPASHPPASHPPVAQTPVAQTPVAAPAGDACSHTDGGSGHLAHADRTCAAAGTASAYAPPALAGALPGAPDAAPAPISGPAAGLPDRAPPDLAELQLLRI